MKHSIIHYFLYIVCFVANLVPNMVQAQEKKTYTINIKVKYALNAPGDTLSLMFGPQTVNQKIRNSFIAIVDKSGYCSLKADVEFPYGYVSIKKLKTHPRWRGDSRMLANELFWEDGDDITINIPDNAQISDYSTNTTFSGKGAEKYNTLYAVRKEQNDYNNELQTHPEKNAAYFKDPYTDTIPVDKEKIERLLHVLQKGKNVMSPFAFEVLQTDILMRDRQYVSEFLVSYSQRELKNKTQADRSFFADKVLSTFFPYPKLAVSDSAIASSLEFQTCYGRIAYLVANLKTSTPDISNIIKEIKPIGNGFKEQSMLLGAINLVGVSEKKHGLNIANNLVTIPRYKLMLEKHRQLLGKNISGFVFDDPSGKKIDLGSYKGKLLLIDFWFSGCGACATYYQNIVSKVEEEFKEDKRFMVISVSCDTKKDMWLRSIANNTYSNKECVNLNTGPEGNLHPLYNYLGVYKSPYVMLVDKNGEVVVLDTPELRASTVSLAKAIRKYL